MSTAIKVIAPVPPEVLALTQTCQELGVQYMVDRCELAVKARVERGIADDNELRQADDMLHTVVKAGDALDAAVAPEISAANARHKALIAAANVWKKRWLDMRGSLSTVIINYKRAKEEMARRQQQEIDRAAEVERRRQEQVAKAALREGNIDAAKQAMEIARTTVAPVIMNSAPVLDHSSGRKLWQIQVTDQMALVKAIAAGVMPLSAIREIDETFLKKEITKRGGLPEAWAGFMRAWQEEKLTVSRR